MKNLEKLTAYMTEQNITHAFITTPENINYFSGFLSDPHERLTALYVTQHKASLIVPAMEVNDAINASNLNTVGYSDTEDAFQVAKRQLEIPDGVVMFIEEEHVTVKREKAIQLHFKPSALQSIDQIIKDMRNIKSEDEIALLKQAARYADQAVETGVAALKIGITEAEVVQIIESEMKRIEGISDMSFSTMVLFGDHAASPHGTPGGRTLNEDEYVLFDLGVIYKGYCSDITRTVAFGTPPQLHQDIHSIVTEANKRAIALVKPGVSIKDIDAAARDYIISKGYGDYFPHRLGHGLGISVHEFPDISSSNENTLQAGMVFTIEPGIYYPETVGVRIEDDILVTEDGYEVLTSYVK
ncbi:Xaa-Pro peptidase family protein [Macrococcus caseolyticus]|uniref:M24 family metallopeptidase n=1 Tax=Macrococcoides caseolyticum TaxID=69966 RepID=UPI0024BD0E89|nr:Xaa-Pro peptidase family protein [Macrococcus caseolyticus]MDJ1155457.1 Xaa-Pro peptidase family protein [Macrococcus caseolyticus]MEB8171435.1 Xaa-Pro peptidase family protein [Macrococcus caseolyticus]